MKQNTVFKKGVLSWYIKNKRDLPWRKTTDPYLIMVSEVMLQQTQVDRVLPKYLAFITRFPTAQKLAQARPADIITLWAGLGYNRRAMMLQRAAQRIAERGIFPTEIEELERLPGIGPYTSRAIRCFAFGKDEPVIDTNIRRIYSRYFYAGKGTMAQIDARVRACIPKGKGATWNNALMDLGAMICTSSSPSCDRCPLKKTCTAYVNGTQESYLRVSGPQKRFAGSTREYRGKILRMLGAAAAHKATVDTICSSLGKEQEYTLRVIRGLMRDGLVTFDGTIVRLP